MQVTGDYLHRQNKSQMKEIMNKPDNSNFNRRSNCPVACALDIIGDKWTILIIRVLWAEGLPTPVGNLKWDCQSQYIVGNECSLKT